MGCTNGCTLSSEEMVERVKAWRAVASRALSREVHPDRITAVYPSDPELIAQLNELVAAEATCCSFLRFKVEEGPRQTAVELTFPEDARALIESVMS